MPNNLRANLELGAQILIAIAVVAVAGVVVKRYLFPGQVNPANLPRIAAGERLNVPNVDWERNEKSLVFFFMKDCVYCKASAPFYRQLIEDASKRKVVGDPSQFTRRGNGVRSRAGSSNRRCAHRITIRLQNTWDSVGIVCGWTGNSKGCMDWCCARAGKENARRPPCAIRRQNFYGDFSEIGNHTE
jgi:hypothetical protein